MVPNAKFAQGHLQYLDGRQEQKDALKRQKYVKLVLN